MRHYKMKILSPPNSQLFSNFLHLTSRIAPRKPINAAIGSDLEGGFELVGGGTLNAKFSTSWLILPK